MFGSYSMQTVLLAYSIYYMPTINQSSVVYLNQAARSVRHQTATDVHYDIVVSR